MSESILCVPRNELPASWQEPSCAIAMKGDVLYSQVQPASVQWLPRDAVEADASLKQLIPYVLLVDAKEERVGCYRRAGSETRLHGLWSIGIGGHVKSDDARNRATLKETIESGLYRELREEVANFPEMSGLDFLGTINEEQTAVGTVHLGLVHKIDVFDPEALVPGQELFDFQWVARERLPVDHLELWSRLALELV